MNKLPASTHGIRPWEWLNALWRDVRYAVRRLAADWQFTTGAVLILALGVGVNTAVFSILNSTLFQPHPFARSHRLVSIYQNHPKSGAPDGASYPAFQDLQKETAVFEGVAAYYTREGRYQVADAQGRPGAIAGGIFEYASANYLDVLGMRQSLGRWFTHEEERQAAPVAVLSWRTWTRNFGADPGVLGKSLYIGGTAVQIVGVGPMALQNSETNPLITSLWMPVSRLEGSDGKSSRASGALTRRDNLFLQVRARLRDGVGIQQAQAAMDITARRLAADYPDTDPGRGITVVATDDVRVHPRIDAIIRPIAVVVMTVVGLVLAIACSNLATLMLVRGSARSAGISVRLALGATRGQLVRHLLTESLVLSLAGTAAGVVIASWALRYLAAVDLPIVLAMRIDYRVLAFAIAAATFSALGFGLTPALQATRVHLAAALRQEKGSSGSSLSFARGWFTMKNILVAGQVAASFLLLVGAALALGILTATQQRSVGYRPAGLAILETDPRYGGYELARARTLLEDMRRRIAALPGVEGAFVTTGLPVDGQFDQKFELEGAKDGETFQVEGRWAGPGYFQTLGIPVQFGRVFDQREAAGSTENIVVSEAFARRFFGAPDAVGKRIRFTDARSRPVEIIGVVGNVRSMDMVIEAPEKYIYRSEAQGGVMPSTIVARASRDEIALVGLMRQELQRLHPQLPVLHAMTMKQRQEMELGLFRVAVVSLGVLGGLGLLLAAVGLYAVVAYAVDQRTNEIGIRIALGARPAALVWIVVRDVSVLVAGGIAIGSALSWVGVTVLESSVAQILGVDAFALAPVALVIIACGAAAAYVPARRAVNTDPIAAIRHR